MRGGRPTCRDPAGIAFFIPCAAPIPRNGLPSGSGLLRLTIALASSIGRLPFTATEHAWTALVLHRAGPVRPPVFIVGHMRSGTTHLHNLLAASGQFATVPPVLAGMPWEALGLARVLRPFVEQCCPKTGYYSKSTYAFSEESVGRVTERWQPFVTRLVTIRAHSSALPHDKSDPAPAARA
jgi:hypothetical protein